METMNKDIFYEVAKKLDANFILNMCTVNKHYSNICNDDTFWGDKLYYDYPNYNGPKVSTYKNTYLIITKNILKPLAVFIGDDNIGNVWVFQHSTYNDIINYINILYQNIIPYNNWSLKTGIFYLLPSDDVISPKLWKSVKKVTIVDGTVTLRPPRHVDEPQTYLLEKEDGTKSNINLLK